MMFRITTRPSSARSALDSGLALGVLFGTGLSAATELTAKWRLAATFAGLIVLVWAYWRMQGSAEEVDNG